MEIDTSITLHKLDVLDHVVRDGGVGRAAESLYVTQPVISEHVRSLGEKLGFDLFYRDGRHLELTEAGEVVHSWARDVLTRTRELERHLAGLADGNRGEVHMGSSNTIGSYVLPPLLARLKRHRPGVELVLAVSDTERSAEDTRRGVLDLAIAVTSPNIEYPGLEQRRIGDLELVPVAAPGLVDDRRITLEQLGRLPFVEPEGATRLSYLEDRLRAHGLEHRTATMRLGNAESMKQAVMAHSGVALLFRPAVAAELADGTLVELVVDGLNIREPVAVLTRRGKTSSPLHDELLEMVEAAL